jgi:hypothetical protein
MFFQQCLNGVILGSIYALIAIGYNLVLGILNMLNLAHGEVFMMGAFIGLSLALWKMPLWAIFPLAMIFAGLVGILVERTCFAPLRKAHLLAPLVSTIALGTVLQNTATNIWGSYARVFPRDFLIGTTFNFGPLVISTTQIAILIIALALMAAVHAFIQRTKVGLAMRAVAEDAENSSLMKAATKPSSSGRSLFLRPSRGRRGAGFYGLRPVEPLHRRETRIIRHGGHGDRGNGQHERSHGGRPSFRRYPGHELRLFHGFDHGYHPVRNDAPIYSSEAARTLWKIT